MTLTLLSVCQIILEFYKSGRLFHSIALITRYTHVSLRHEAELLSWRVGPTEDLYLRKTEHTKYYYMFIFFVFLRQISRRNEKTVCRGKGRQLLLNYFSVLYGCSWIDLAQDRDRWGHL
jgi:hypothetical protein